MKNQKSLKTKKYFHSNWFWAGLWFAQILLFFVLSKIQAVVDFAEWFFGFTQFFRTSWFKGLRFSAGDIFYTLLILFLLWQGILLFRKMTRKSSVKRILIVLNGLYFVYQILWGLLYFEKPLFPDDGLKQKLPIAELKYLTGVYLAKCDSVRAPMPEAVFKIRSLPGIRREILQKQKENAKIYKGENRIQLSVKPSLYRKVMSYTGISGYYNPFSAEAQYDPDLPDTYIPFTLAHETSHQIGFAREEEADFIAFLVGKDSKNADLKFSTDWFVFKSLLMHIYPKDSMFVKNTIKNLPQKLKNDYRVERKFGKDHSGELENFFYHSNDLFLKSNQQDGIHSYNYFIYLLLQYEKEKGSRFTTQSQKHK